MANNNNVLFNAALSGCLQGMMANRSPFPAVSGGADNIATVGVAKAFATEVDSLIGADAAITGAAGVCIAITGGSNAQIAPLFEKINILQSICQGLWYGRWSKDGVAADYANLAAQAAAMYTDALTVLVSP